MTGRRSAGRLMPIGRARFFRSIPLSMVDQVKEATFLSLIVLWVRITSLKKGGIFGASLAPMVETMRRRIPVRSSFSFSTWEVMLKKQERSELIFVRREKAKF